MSQQLQGKIALVTGSSGGIGAAVARCLAAGGARVVVHANRNLRSAEALARELSADGTQARAIAQDLSSHAGPAELVRSAFSVFGWLDILVNNAGVFEPTPADAVDMEKMERLLNVNLRAVVVTIREFVRLRRSAQGRIINISSIAARMPSPGGGVYAATKAAVESLTRSYAAELAPRGFTVNAVAPGITQTEMAERGFSPDTLRLLEASSPMGRLGRPHDIAEVVAFLCTEAAGWINGQVIAVDGGQLASATSTLKIAQAANGVRSH
jgi:3-oxoacyl-[acyl-carrier protein] reductase